MHNLKNKRQVAVAYSWTIILFFLFTAWKAIDHPLSERGSQISTIGNYNLKTVDITYQLSSCKREVTLVMPAGKDLGRSKLIQSGSGIPVSDHQVWNSSLKYTQSSTKYANVGDIIRTFTGMTPCGIFFTRSGSAQKCHNKALNSNGFPVTFFSSAITGPLISSFDHTRPDFSDSLPVQVQFCIRDSSILGPDFQMAPAPYHAETPQFNLSVAYLNTPYSQSLSINVPSSVSVQDITIPLTNLSIPTSNGISGLPTGLSYSCDPPNCVFNANTLGCILISGIPVNVSPDTFPFSFSATASTPFAPIPVTLPEGFLPVSSYHLILESTPSPQICVQNGNLPSCVGMDFAVNYTGMFTTFGSGNIFTVQLSDGNGNFDQAINIGSISSTATSGTVNAVIPSGLTAGPNYRIRVNSSVPSILGDPSQSFDIQTTNQWTGNINIWENASNWSCNGIPNVTQDVQIGVGIATIESMGSCRTLTVDLGAGFIVQSGATFTIIP